MLPATTKSTLILDSPCVMKAWLSEGQLTLYRSVLVTDDDLPDHVKELLNQRPHRVLLAEAVEDEDMLFGEGLLSVYRFTD